VNRRFEQTLNYSSVNEDWRTEWEALRLSSEDRVLCVTGSGDRPLDLLVAAPVQVVAIDCVPAQNHLLQLKMAALAALEYHEYVAFLGLTAASPEWRARTFEQQLELGAPTESFWRHRVEALRRGVLYQGRWERHYRRVAAFARLVRGKDLDTLFGFEDLDEQRRFIDAHWDTAAWRLAWRAVCSPLTARFLLGDPAFYAYVQVDPARYLYDRMREALHRFLARDSFMVALALRGHLLASDLPPYLTPEGHAVLRERLHLVKIVDAELIDYLRAPNTPSFTRFSLSDVPSYLAPRAFEALVHDVIRCAEPRARVVIRQFLTRYDLPPGVADRFVREPELERRCAIEDRSFAYEFIIGMVHNEQQP
jgi:S-adenosylmethionine-diacylglycerol 3-amino-3-carboxypropyl transferase